MAAPWITISQAAKQLGVSVQCLRDHCNGKAGPALKFKRAGKKMLVQLDAAEAHLQKHGGKRIHVKPLDQPSRPLSPPPPESAVFAGNPHEILEKAMNALKDGQYLSPQHVQAIAAAARELRMKDESTSRAEQRFEADQVLSFLRSVGQAWVSSTEKNVGAIATKLVAYVKSQFGVDLEAQNMSAAAMVEQFLRMEMRAVIAAVNTQVVETEKKIGDKAA